MTSRSSTHSRSAPTIWQTITSGTPGRTSSAEAAEEFSKLEPERDFVMWLQCAYWEATGSEPALTARHADDSRDVGPFARFAHECLRLVGTKHADVVGLINELHRVSVDLEGRSSRVGSRD
jgi:hypothetical protein